jgi:hypothetical protein
MWCKRKKGAKVAVLKFDLLAFQRSPPPQIVRLLSLFSFSLQKEELGASRPRYLARRMTWHLDREDRQRRRLRIPD